MGTPRKFVKSVSKADVNFALKSLWDEVDRLTALVEANDKPTEVTTILTDEVSTDGDSGVETPANESNGDGFDIDACEDKGELADYAAKLEPPLRLLKNKSIGNLRAELKEHILKGNE